MLYRKYLVRFYRNAGHFSRGFEIPVEMFYIGAAIFNVQILLFLLWNILSSKIIF